MLKIKIIGLAFFAAVSFSLIAAKPKAKEISLAEYISAAEQPKSEESPKFNATLWIQPVEVACHPSGSFKPEEAFGGNFADQFRSGATAFFQARGRFEKVDTSAGDLSLALKWVAYNGGKGNPPKLAIGIEMNLYLTSSKVSLLVGKAESGLPVIPRKLKKPVAVPVGGKEWIIKDGTYRTAEICRAIFNRLDEQLVQNSREISKRINK